MIIASFPKGSYPEYTWPIGTWPEAPEAAVDIVYTEVFEFTLAIASTAEFEVVLPNDASVDVVSTDIIVSGAGNAAVNGTYAEYGTRNSKPLYRMASEQSATGYFYIVWSTYNMWHITIWGDTGSDMKIYIAARYASTDAVATPDLVTTWEFGVSGGVEPFPTVTAGGDATLTEVAAFTLEMPQVITMEVYEELHI